MISIISRLISPFIASFAIYLTSRGFNITSEFTDTLTLVVASSLIALYGIIHKLIEKFYFNIKKEKNI